MAPQEKRRVMLTITPAQQRLHQLTWQAGEWMDSGWWQALSLAEWQHSYQHYPPMRGALNLLIARRHRAELHPLPATLTPQQQQLMALEARLSPLCIALGLLAMACPDYLLLGEYRRQLALPLGAQGCDQLLALGTFSASPVAELAAEHLVDAALARGAGWLRSAGEHCPVISALSLLLPPQAGHAAPVLGSPVSWLLRIGRFL